MISRKTLVYGIVIGIVALATAIFLGYGKLTYIDSDSLKCYPGEGREDVAFLLPENLKSVSMIVYYGRIKADCTVETDKFTKSFTMEAAATSTYYEWGDNPSYVKVKCDVYYYDYNDGEYKYCGVASLNYGTPSHPSCENECESGEVRYYCDGDVIYKQECGDYDSDPCLEWSEPKRWKDCDLNDGYYCVGNKKYYRDYYCKQEWSNYAECDYYSDYIEDCSDKSGWYCRDSYTREYREYKCVAGSCTYSVTETERCPSGYKCEDGKCKREGTINLIDWIINILTE